MARPNQESSRWKAVTRNAFAAVPFAAAIALVGILTDLHTPLNDFWGNHYLSQRVDFHDLNTFYDGFYPVGYTVLLRLLPRFGYPVLSALGINVALTWLLTFLMLGVLRLRGLAILPSLIIAGLVLLFPQVFQCLCTPGADSGAMVFFTVGTCMLLVALLASTPRAWWYALAGGLLGMAALWRYHALPAAIFLLVTAALVYRKRIAGVMLALASCAVVYGCQIAVNVLSGHSPLQTYEAFNIYLHVHDVNWYHTAATPSVGTPLSVIFSDKSAFLSSYLATFVRIFPALSAPLILCLLAKDRPLRRAAAFWLGFCFLYSALMATADSGRAVLLALPVSLSFLAVSGHALWVDRLRARVSSASWPRPVGTVAVALLLGACATKDIASVVSWSKASHHYRALEQVCVREGITDARQVYSTDLYLYFRDLPPFRPSYSGGWLDLPPYHSNNEAHGVSLGSEKAFLQDCRSRGIRIIHLTPGCKRAAAFLYRIYNFPRIADGMHFVTQVGKSRLFRLE
jgi:hypothetical protein